MIFLYAALVSFSSRDEYDLLLLGTSLHLLMTSVPGYLSTSMTITITATTIIFLGDLIFTMMMHLIQWSFTFLSPLSLIISPCLLLSPHSHGYTKTLPSTKTAPPLKSSNIKFTDHNLLPF